MTIVSVKAPRLEILRLHDNVLGAMELANYFQKLKYLRFFIVENMITDRVCKYEILVRFVIGILISVWATF